MIPSEQRANRLRKVKNPKMARSALADLLGIHERAYLEHCRAFALSLARKAT